MDDQITESQEMWQTCEECRARNVVTFRIGPPHGGWNEDTEIECAGCGASLGEVKSFDRPVVRLASAERPARR
jgi:hypothetical protein